MLHRRAYPRYWEWSDQYEVIGMLGGVVRTVFGWPLHVGPGTSARSVRNFGCQANGAECLRLACSLATEAGIEVCAPVHDAILVGGPVEEAEDVVARARAAMDEASRVVLGGRVLRIKHQVIKYPDRLLDDKTRPMWDRTMARLDAIDPERK